MVERTTEVAIPIPFAASAIDWDRASACSLSVMNAALPYFTSRTKAEIPSAAFFDTIDEVISGIDATVPVTSRNAYIRLSAGTSESVCPTIANPISPTCFCNSFIDRSTRKPAILSSLSKVPPVCPNPRPEIIGTLSPQAARAGAKMIETLSPTPPVECLSTTRWLQSLGQAKTFPESLIALVRKIVEFSSSPFSNISLNQSMTRSSLSEPSTTPFTISAIESLMPHPRRIHRVILRYSFPCPIGIEPDFGQDFRSQNHLEQSAHVLRHLYLLSTPWCPRMYHRIECL